MTDFSISLAGIPVGVRAIFEQTRDFCADYLCDEQPCVSFTVTEEDLRFEQLRSEQTAEEEGRRARVWEKTYLEQLALYRKIAEDFIERGVLLFHGSAIAVDGEVYLFTARSGVGKSTHARLWRQRFGERAFMVNDDKPLLRFTEDGILVCGTPWDGKHHLSRNTMLPLRAVGVITRGEDNRVEELSLGEAYSLLLQQSYQSNNAERMARVLQYVQRIVTGVPVRRVICNREQEAADISYEGLRQ